MDEREDEFSPTAEWRAAFDAQATEALVARLIKYAKTRVKMMMRTDGGADPLLARELVLDALEDTLMGVVSWDPSKVSLLTRLMALIQSRTRHEMIRMQRLPHRSLDDSADDTSTDGSPLENEVCRTAARDHKPDDSDVMRERAAWAVTELRRAAGDNASTLQLLAAYERGAVTRQEVMRMTGMSAKTYDNARRHVLRLVTKLEPQTYDTAPTARQEMSR